MNKWGSLANEPLLEQILLRYLYKEELEDLLSDLADNTSGPVAELAGRLLENPHFKPAHAIHRLRVWQLRDLCRQRGQSDEGNRGVLEAALVGLVEREALDAKMKHVAGKRRRASVPEGLLHPKIAAVADSRFKSGHLADAVEAAFKEVNTRVKSHVQHATGRELDGADLMNFAFSPRSPISALAPLETESGRSEQQGYMLIFAGSMQAIRNPKAHANIVIDQNRAAQHLMLASLLMSKLDEARVP
ncbi:MAG: TIGR02391 family protein [Euryarchaeota archaeon]|nr:TIGR02391 family protein [Euryarchaeota archaeon]